MTRINVLEPSELHKKHLMGEIHEITRVYGYVRKAQARKINRYNLNDKIKQPGAYTMGTGHVRFFYDKLGFITERYYALNREAAIRKFNVNPIKREDLVSGIDDWWFGDYQPTQEAIEISKARINERLEYME